MFQEWTDTWTFSCSQNYAFIFVRLYNVKIKITLRSHSRARWTQSLLSSLNQIMFCGIILRYGTHFVCHTWAAPSEFGTYRLCEQRRFRRACAFAQSRQNLRCSLIQAVSQAEPSDRKPDPWRLWMAGHAQLKFVMTECSKTQIRLTRPTCNNN